MSADGFAIPVASPDRMRSAGHMEHADAGAVSRVLMTSWELDGPLHAERVLPGGATSDVFDIRVVDGRRFAAKLTYDLRSVVEPALRTAELVQQRTGIRTGSPVRAMDGSLTVDTDSVAGLQHPLALMEWVEGAPVRVEDRAEECGRLLARVHETQVGLDVSAPDTVIAYLQDQSVDYRGRLLIARTVQDAVDAVTGLGQLTWGTCYGDGPELRDTASGLALIDWGAVTRAPLLWDVVQWAASAGGAADRFVAAYSESGGPAANEMRHLAVLRRLLAAHQLRFRMFRLANGRHYDESATGDRNALVTAATVLGVDSQSILDSIA